jgi:4-hydroxy-tetrahydrodipicolinate synthase
VSRVTDPHPLAGVTVPVVTPLDARGRPDAAVAEPLLRDLAAAGVRSLLVLGTNGEGAVFAPADAAAFAADIAACWRDLSDGAVFVAAFGSGTSETRTRIAAILRRAAPDALVIPPPHYFRYTPDELFGHYAAVHDCGAPVVVYNAPRYTGNPIHAEALLHIAGLDGVIGIKDSSNDDTVLLAALQVARDVDGFAVSQGNERRLAWALRRGAAGITPGLANIAPVPCVELLSAANAGDEQTALRCQTELDRLSRMHEVRPGVACMKAALSLLGRCPPEPAPPMHPYSEDERGRLATILGESRARLLGTLTVANPPGAPHA